MLEMQHPPKGHVKELLINSPSFRTRRVSALAGFANSTPLIRQ